MEIEIRDKIVYCVLKSGGCWGKSIYSTQNCVYVKRGAAIDQELSTFSRTLPKDKTQSKQSKA